jgi:hypothetical protein
VLLVIVVVSVNDERSAEKKGENMTELSQVNDNKAGMREKV